MFTNPGITAAGNQGGAGGGGGFDPIAGVSATAKALYRTDVGASVHITSNKCTQWDDQTANAYNLTQANSARQMLTNTRTQNSVLALEGYSNSYYDSPSFTQALPFTQVFVYKSDGTGDNCILMCDTASTVAETADEFSAYRMNDGSAQDFGTPDSNPHVAVAIHNGASSEFWLDGVQLTVPGSPGTNGVSNGIRIGSDPAAANYLVGFICVASLYVGATSTADRNYLESGWGTIYGISVI